ncbi:hypothetical protein ACB265_06375 [Aeromonas dhakensis]
MLQGKQQAVARAIAAEGQNPFQAKSNRNTLPALTADGRKVGRRYIVEGLSPEPIDQSGTIRCAITGRTLFIAPGSTTDCANPGAAEQLNPEYKPSLYQVVADNR